MTRLVRALAAAAVITTIAVLVGSFVSAQVAGTSSAQSVAVPAYFSADGSWQQLVAAVPALRLAVMNPDSGAGSAPNPTLGARVARARAAGIQVLGYVHTSYGQRAVAALEAEVDAYYAWYHVDGIFFDEAGVDCRAEPYYAALRGYVKAKNTHALVVINPATATQACYMAAADVVVTFEGSYESYLAAGAPPAWTRHYPAGRFWHLVYDTAGVDQLRQVLSMSRARRAGRVYVTDDALPNPWSGLPSGVYWDDELHAVGRSPSGRRK